MNQTIVVALVAAVPLMVWLVIDNRRRDARRRAVERRAQLENE